MNMKVIPIEKGCTVDKVLENNKGVLQSVLVIGWSKGDERLTASVSTDLMDAGKILFLIESFKQELLTGGYDL